MGQYLRPTPQHLPWWNTCTPDTFKLYKEIAEKKGFEHVASGPLVRRLVSRRRFQSAGGAGRRTEPPTPNIRQSTTQFQILCRTKSGKAAAIGCWMSMLDVLPFQ